ncbi:hypothetical protein [Methanobacterium sp. MBAC-LM]|uniref:hypothetical protein n=1 Tax=Methanobacterium sp. MBAC-LM TaxID=3412034 RepID=UPI003C73DB53
MKIKKDNVNPEYFKVQSNGSVSNVNGEYSNIQPVSRTVLFIIITGGFYQLHRFYRNWGDFKAYKNLDISGWLG